MLLIPKRNYLKLLLFLFSIIVFLKPKLAFAEDAYSTYFGPYYRTNTFTPILVYFNKDFQAKWLENKYTKAQLIYNQDKEAEGLVKLLPDGTRLSITNEQQKKEMLSLNFQLIPEEVSLVVILSDKKLTLTTKYETTRIVETNILPETDVAFAMIDVLILTDDYQESLSAKQSEALKNWVISGGVIIFESLKTIQTHASISVPLLKLLLKQASEEIKETLIIEELKSIAQTLQNKNSCQSLSLGGVGVHKFNKYNDYESIENFSNGIIKWNIRNRNTSLTKENQLKNEITNQQSYLVQKIVFTYFLIMMIFLLLKPKKYFVTSAIILIGLIIIPILYLTPTEQLNAHYNQLNIRSYHSKISVNKEQIYFKKGDIPELAISLNNNSPFFIHENAKITLIKNKEGGYALEKIQSFYDYLTASRTSTINQIIIQPFEKNNSEYIAHRNPLSTVMLLTENQVHQMNYSLIVNNKDGMISKIEEVKEEFLRDKEDTSIWYLNSNQLFYSPNSKVKTITTILIQSTTFPFKVKPELNLKKSFYTYMITNK